MMDFLFKPGPRSLRSEALRLCLLSAVLIVLGAVFHWPGWSTALTVAVVVLGTAGDYVWWHFRPYKKPPVTRYTKNP